MKISEFIQNKTEVLEKIWNSTTGEITQETLDDWKRLETRIDREAPGRTFIFRRYTYGVAAVLLILLCNAAALFYLNNEKSTADPVLMAEVFVPFGETKTILLPDSTEVWINSGTTIVYPKDFTRFDTRSVYLTGNASFKVHKDAAHPFIVKSKDINVTALGTVFTVESYPIQPLVTATLEEGSIRVDMNSSKLTYTLEPGQQLAYNVESGKSVVQNVNIDQFTKIREGHIILHNYTIDMLVQVLERKYNVSINYDSKRYDGTYNVKFAPNESLTSVLDVLKMLAGFEYTINRDTIILY